MESLKKTGVATHQKFHIDEGVGIFCLINIGKIINCYPQDITFFGNSVFERDPNIVYLGGGMGEYDEHPYDGDKSKKQESSISILARDLKIDSSSPYYKMVQYAHINDTKGAKNQCELGNIMKEMFNQNYTENEVWLWLENILSKKLQIENKRLNIKLLAKKMRGTAFSGSERLKELFSFNVRGRRVVNRIVLSKNFNFNDLVAVRIAMSYGYNKFGTTNNTKLLFVNPETYRYNKNDLCIGLKEGLFSSMPAEKMAKLFNVDNRNDYYQVMKYVRNINSRGGYNPFELAALLADSHLVGVDPIESFKAFEKLYDLYINKQRLYNSACAEIREGFYGNGTNFIKIKNEDRIIKIGILHTDRSDMVNPAFMQFECDVVVLKNCKGQIQILPKNRKFSLNVVMKRVQIVELERKGFDKANLNYDTLGKTGTLCICPEWHLQKKDDGGQLLLNGSLTHTMVNPTKVSIKFIKKILVEATQDYFRQSNN